MTKELTDAADAAAQKAAELHPDDEQALATSTVPGAMVRTKPQQSIAVHPAQMIQALIERPDADIDKVEKLFDLQERWEANEAKKAYYAAVAAAQAEIPPITYDSWVEHSGIEFGFASLAGIIEKVRPILSRHDLTLTWRTGTTERGDPVVTCSLTHGLGYGEDTTLAAPPDTSGKKNPIQSLRSTVSYLKRTTAEALLGLATKRDDADDGNDAGDADEKAKPEMPGETFAGTMKSAAPRLKTVADCRRLISKLQTKYTLTENQVTNIMSYGGTDDSNNA